MTHVIINTDGSCLGNQNAGDSPGGFAATIEWGQDSLVTVTGGDPATTNNRMELAAVIEALRVLRQTPELAGAAITVRSDSQYVIKAFNDNWIGGWKRRSWRTSSGDPVKNQEQWHDLIALAEGLDITWEWVKGHSGDPGNEHCDQLANNNASAASAQPEYWVEADAAFGHEIPPQSHTPEAEPDPQDRDPGAEALRILEGISSLLDQCPTYESFRVRAKRLMEEINR